MRGIERMSGVSRRTLSAWLKEQAKRQQLERFVRKTLSFSNCIKMHEIFLKLFIHRYNMNYCRLLARYHFKNHHYQKFKVLQS